jgi:hypothetical protein
VDVFLTFADTEKRVRPRLLGTPIRVPSGRIHAAESGASCTLCGIALDQLSQFGRSRHPFEKFPFGQRCPSCHIAAGRPFG